MPQNARPTADVSVVNWSPTPIYAQINAPTPTDSTFVSLDPSLSGSFEVRLDDLAWPQLGVETLRIRLRKTGTSAALSVIVTLLQGSTVIAVRIVPVTSSSFTTVALPLTNEEIARITGSYSDLRVRVQRVLGQQVFNTSDTWTCPAGVTTVVAECWGGGGAGCGGDPYNGTGGGGGGAYAINVVSVVPSTNYNVTVGGGNTNMSGTPSWFSNTNVQPTSLSEGAYADPGLYCSGANPGGDMQGGDGGAARNCIGLVRFSGGSGGDGEDNNEGGGGGGGASASSTADGADGQSGGGGFGGVGGAEGGARGGSGGGAHSSGGNGGAPGGGGGGGGAGVDGGPGQGANGRMILTW